MSNNSTLQLVAVASISLFTGCCIGALATLPSATGSSTGSPFQLPFTSHVSPSSQTPSTAGYLSDDEIESPSEDEEEDEDQIAIDSKSLNEIAGECRMALVVRSDLKMEKGKAAAQCAHAAVACYRLMSEPGSEAQNLPLLERWNRRGQAKIALKCSDLDDMEMLFAKALSLNVNAYIVHDAGRTQVAAGSATVLGLGPAPRPILDMITGDLRLY